MCLRVYLEFSLIIALGSIPYGDSLLQGYYVPKATRFSALGFRVSPSILSTEHLYSITLMIFVFPGSLSVLRNVAWRVFSYFVSSPIYISRPKKTHTRPSTRTSFLTFVCFLYTCLIVRCYIRFSSSFS